MPGPLEGITILDWTIWQQGPVATAMLGDLGANVIKIEENVGGDPGRGYARMVGVSAKMAAGRNFLFEVANRNKRSITLNLRHDKGKEVVYRLVEHADVFVQNFRRTVAEKLKLDYQTLKQRNPKLIYATATGFGSKGPDRDTPSFDQVAMAKSGMMTLLGEPDMPPLTVTGALADQTSALMLAYGILAAIVARERLGVGQQIEVSQLASMMAIESSTISAKLMIGQDLPRRKRSEVGNPLSNYYRCADDKWVALSALQSDRHWPAFCKLIKREDLRYDERFENMDRRSANAKELIAILDDVFASKTRADWIVGLKEIGDLPYSAVNTISDLVEDPQVLENDYVVDFDHPVMGKTKMIAPPVQFGETPAAIRLPAPDFGQHTEEILLEAGYSWEEIVGLREEGVC